MGLIVGILIVIGCTLGGYAAMGGHLAVLWQPFEGVIIVGAAVGAFVIGNTGSVIKATAGSVAKPRRGSQYSKEHYTEPISLLYHILKVAKTTGNLGPEKNIETTHASARFTPVTAVPANNPATTIMYDYLHI